MTPGNLLERLRHFPNKATLAASRFRHNVVTGFACLLRCLALRAMLRPPRPPDVPRCRPNIRSGRAETLVNAINPHTPGYEAIDPKDPDKYVGFDVDSGRSRLANAWVSS